MKFPLFQKRAMIPARTALRLTLFFVAGSLVGCGSRGSVPASPPLPKISIASSPLPNGMLTFAYSQKIQASGGVAPLTWRISSGSLPQGLSLASSSTNTATISGMPNAAQSATFSVEVTDSKSQTASQSYTITINNLGTAQLLPQGQAPAGIIEIQGLSAGPFNPASWQRNTLNWVPDVRIPMLAPLTTGPWQNIYSPWALEQPNGWRMFYGGWDGTSTPNDRVYSVTTSDFLSFQNRILVIDNGDFQHVNNVNVTQLTDGSMHMICTVLVDPNSNDKPAYFSSPDGIRWNGTPEPYSAKLSDVVSVANDPNYAGWDFNGGNVLLWDQNAWTFYYSVGIYGGIDQVYRATATAAPAFQKTGVALNTPHYSNDVKKFTVGGQSWYLMALYVERVAPDPTPPAFTFALSNDGNRFGSEQTLFSAASANDTFLMTPSFVTQGNNILGVLYGANPTDLGAATSQIFARWLQAKPVVTDGSGTIIASQGAFGPDRQWLQAPASGSLTGNIAVYAEDGITPLGRGSINLRGGRSYALVLN